jgi:hypothetical protein
MPLSAQREAIYCSAQQHNYTLFNIHLKNNRMDVVENHWAQLWIPLELMREIGATGVAKLHPAAAPSSYLAWEEWISATSKVRRPASKRLRAANCNKQRRTAACFRLRRSVVTSRRQRDPDAHSPARRRRDAPVRRREHTPQDRRCKRRTHTADHRKNNAQPSAESAKFFLKARVGATPR